MTFADPEWLGGLIIPVAILALAVINLRRTSREAAIEVPTLTPWIEAWASAERGIHSRGRRGWRFSRTNQKKLTVLAPAFLRSSAIALMFLALARPQSEPLGKNRRIDGLDIQLVIDTSGSMRAEDFVLAGKRPTRLDVVKTVIDSFISARGNDRIGLVVFGTEAFTQAPLTLDHDLLREFLKYVDISMAGDATAIGDGLATAVKRLQDLPSKGKVVILLTDGENNAGRIDPITAAEAAKALGVRVYTIGVGGKGKVPIRVNGRRTTVEVSIDEALLEKIAALTDGRYFRARDTESLINVYRSIDRLEKSAGRAPIREVRRELYGSFLWGALGLILLEVLRSMTRRRVIP